MGERSPRVELAAHLALIAAVTWFAFQPALSAGFVNWDDGANILENPSFRGFTAEHLRWMFTTTHLGPYQPLSWLSLALDHAVGGLDAHVYHRTNLVLHVAGAIALYFLARRLFALLPGGWIRPELRGHAALAAALLFAVHPLRCESVCWVTERRDVLSAPFYFLTLHFWLGYATAPRGGGRREHALALLMLLLSLLAKASAMVVPFLLVLLDIGPLRASARERGLRTCIVEKLPMLALSVAFAFVALRGQSADAALASSELHGPLTRAIQAGHAAWFHVTRTLWPAGLRPIHSMPAIERFLEPALLVPALVVLATTVLATATWRRWPAFAWSWWAFLIVLAPVSGLVHSGPQLVAERYSYLACVPFALLAAGGLGVLAARHRAGPAVLALAVVAVLAWRTREQSKIWHSSESLWTHTLALDPDNDVALENFGVLELELGQSVTDPARSLALLRSANERLERAVARRVEPRRLYNLAATHVTLADRELDRREQHLARAVECSAQGRSLARSLGRPVEPRWNVIHALALNGIGRAGEALPIAEEARAGSPRDVEIARLVANLRMNLGRAREAAALLEDLTRAAPDNSLLWHDLARAWERAGDAAKSRAAAMEGRARAERTLGARAVELPWYGELVRRSQAPR